MIQIECKKESQYAKVHHQTQQSMLVTAVVQDRRLSKRSRKIFSFHKDKNQFLKFKAQKLYKNLMTHRKRSKLMFLFCQSLGTDSPSGSVGSASDSYSVGPWIEAGARVAQWVVCPTHTRLVPGSKYDWCKNTLVSAMIAT